MPARTYAMEVCGARTRLAAVTIAPGQGARGVDAHARTLQSEHIREAACSDGDGAAGCSVNAGSRRKELCVVGIRDGEEYSILAAHQRGASYVGRVQRHVSGFEQQPLLRVHHGSLRWRHPKRNGIKELCVLHKRAVCKAICLHAAQRVHIHHGRQRPPSSWHESDGVARRSSLLPQRRNRAADASRPATRITTHGKYRRWCVLDC
eukprot:scaffold27061_cov78-Phaeocystis_antarctica.AAC.3